MTLATSALKCALQLGRANATGTAIADLAVQIKQEIGDTIRFYNRMPYHLSEFRGLTLATVSGTVWYSTVEMSSGDGDQSARSVDVNDVLSIDYMRENPGSSGLNEPMYRMAYRDFERLLEGSTPSGPPNYYTMFAGQIGIWPTPDDAYSIYFSATVKPAVPVDDADTSVWLEQAEEMIIAGAARRVCLKYIRDAERAQEFAVIEQEAAHMLQKEHVLKSSSRRLKVHN